MSDANIQHVRNLYAAFKSGDIATILDSLAPDATWAMVGDPDAVPMAGLRSGKQGAADFFRLMAETVEITRFEPREFKAVDDRVYVHGFWSYVARGNGYTGENEWLHVFTFRDGKVISYRGHNNMNQIAAVLAKPRTGDGSTVPRAVVEAMVAAFQRGDIASVIERFSEDCVLRETEAYELPYRGVLEGKAGAAKFFDAMGSVFAPNKLTVDTWVCEGDRVVAMGVWGGIAHSTGKAWQSHIALTFCVRNGKVIEFRGYDDTAVTVASLRP